MLSPFNHARHSFSTLQEGNFMQLELWVFTLYVCCRRGSCLRNTKGVLTLGPQVRFREHLTTKPGTFSLVWTLLFCTQEPLQRMLKKMVLRMSVSGTDYIRYGSQSCLNTEVDRCLDMMSLTHIVSSGITATETAVVSVARFRHRQNHPSIQ